MNEQKAKRGQKAMVWAVVALLSLATNLFLGGLLLGKSFRPDRPPGGIGPIALLRPPQGFDPATSEIVERTRQKHHHGIRKAMTRMGEARAEAVEALCAKEFDEAKAREAFRAFQSVSNTAHESMNESLMDAARQMTSEQRELLRESLHKGRG